MNTSLRHLLSSVILFSGVCAETHVVRVNPDGTFSPQRIEIRDGDTVEWLFAERTDSIIPIPDPDTTGGPQSFQPYDPGNPNEFTGPLPRAASGIFTLGPDGEGLNERTLTPQEIAQLPDPGPTHVGNRYLLGGGDEYATMDSTWQSPNVTGVFIRLRWNQVQPNGPDEFDWAVMDREIEQAVRNGKLYNLSFKAGALGTPSWIFDPGPLHVPPLELQDHGGAADPKCGDEMTLGSPCNENYQRLYFNLWRRAAERIRARNSWYRALAYVKLSGANLHSHENRLPKACDPGCPCNPMIWAQEGEYTPEGLYNFYREQSRVLAEEFPDKELCYQLIQAGFPRVNDLGEYFGQTPPLSDPMNHPLPGGTEQTETIIADGWNDHGKRFVVAHNGLGPRPQDLMTQNGVPRDCCPQEGQPHPLQGPFGGVGSGCPNPFVLEASRRGHITGFQTENAGKDVGNPEELHSTLLNARDNSDAIYVEIYESRFWEVDNQPNAMPITIGGWADLFHQRRRDWFPELGDPLPPGHRHTFTRTTGDLLDTQVLHYVHGARADSGLPDSVGEIAILPEVNVRIRSIRRAGVRAVRLEIEATVGCSVMVQHSPDLQNWQELTTVPNPDGVVMVDDLNATAARKFYRAVLVACP